MPEIVFISDHTNILTDPSLWWFRAAPITHMHLLITTMWAGGEQVTRSGKPARRESLGWPRSGPDSLLLVGSSHISENKSMVESVFVRFVTCKREWGNATQSPWSSVCVIPPLVTEISQKYLPPLHSQVSVVRLCKSGAGVIGPELVKCHDSEMF